MPLALAGHVWWQSALIVISWDGAKVTGSMCIGHYVAWGTQQSLYVCLCLAFLSCIATSSASGRCNSGVMGAGGWSSLLLMYALRRWFIYYLCLALKAFHLSAYASFFKGSEGIGHDRYSPILWQEVTLWNSVFKLPPNSGTGKLY